MNVTVYRHQEYGKFLITIEDGFSTTNYTLYDMSITEVAEFIRAIIKEEN